jgi:hypothetical protein
MPSKKHHHSELFHFSPSIRCQQEPVVAQYDVLGCAGAATAEACVLCAAGTYQTGSGPPRQQGSHGSEAMRIACGVDAVVPPGWTRAREMEAARKGAFSSRN